MECSTPALPRAHRASIHILPLIVLRINILEINRRHDCRYLHLKMENILNWAGKGDPKSSQVVFQGYCPLPLKHPCYPKAGSLMEIWASPLPCSKVSLTNCKSEISLNKPKLKQKSVFFCNLMMYWPWGQGQGSLSNHVLSSFTLTSEKANQRYMISPFLQLTRPFDVGNHVTSAFK